MIKFNDVNNNSYMNNYYYFNYLYCQIIIMIFLLLTKQDRTDGQHLIILLYDVI